MVRAAIVCGALLLLRLAPFSELIAILQWTSFCAKLHFVSFSAMFSNFLKIFSINACACGYLASIESIIR